MSPVTSSCLYMVTFCMMDVLHPSHLAFFINSYFLCFENFVCMCVSELLRSRFEEQGLLQGDSRGFEPHLTIMKLSRASKLRSQVCTCALSHTVSIELGHEKSVDDAKYVSVPSMLLLFKDKFNSLAYLTSLINLY